MVWSDYLPIPLVIPPGAGDTDDRIVIDSNGISIYDGAVLVIRLTPTSPFTGSPEIIVTNAATDRISIGVGTTGGPEVFFHEAAGNGRAQIYFAQTAGRDALTLLMVGEGGDDATLILREDASGFGEIVATQEITAIDVAQLPAFVSETWHDLVLLNGWTAQTPCQYRMGPDGFVHLQGSLTGGTTTPTTVIANLPAFYRPVAGADHYYTVAQPNFNTSQGTIDILPNGDIRCIFSPGVASLSLAGINWANNTI